MSTRNNIEYCSPTEHPITRREFLKYFGPTTCAAIMFLIGGCSWSPNQTKDQPEQPKTPPSSTETRIVDSSTREGIVELMALNAENVLFELALGGMLDNETKTSLTSEQIDLIIASMRDMISGASIDQFIEAGSVAGLLNPERVFHIYLATEANHDHLKGYTAGIYTLARLISLHWNHINWHEDTEIPNKQPTPRQSGFCKVIESKTKKSILLQFILTAQKHILPLENSGAIERFTANISTKDNEEYELPITIEGVKEFIERLEYKYNMFLSHPPNV